MKFRATLTSIAFLGLMAGAFAEDDGKGPRAGYFETEMTILELLGAEGAASISDVLDADQELKWKIYVPKTYTPIIGGSSGGAQVAAILATSKPHMFKGGLFIGSALSWKDRVPAGIDQDRMNRYVFMSGSNHPALGTVQSTALTYREAGVEHTKFIVMPNVARKAPSASYIQLAIEYLDGQEVAEPDG